MKYKTFRALVIGGVAVVFLGVGYALRGCLPDDDGPQPPPRSKPGKVVRKGPPEPPAGPGGLRAMDQAILARIKQGISGSKVKDAFKGRAWKVNLYAEGGKLARLKIDLDRDGKWDEKWTIEGGGKVKRFVSPSDDGKRYPLEYRLDGERWRPKSAAAKTLEKTAPAPKPAAPKPVPPGGQALRSLDEAILARIARGISGKKQKDALSGKPWKVNLYQDAGQSGVNRLKLDLDRDGKWDEKWTIERVGGQEKIKRQVAPSDDQNYTVEYRLREGRWVRKK